MPIPKRQLVQTVCPVCETSITVKRSGALNKGRFDVTRPIYAKDFIKIIESQGRGKGFAAVQEFSIQQALADPVWNEYIQQLHANVTMLKDYLDRINP